MPEPAPYCTHKMPSGWSCGHSTRHESGKCPQHRSGRTPRGQIPLSERPMHKPSVPSTKENDHA